MSDLDQVKVGQWVTLISPTGREIRGQVVSVEADTHGITTYTLHQFPERAAEPEARYWDIDWNEIT